MSQSMSNPSGQFETPAELRATEAALDTLAKAERDSAPPTLEARLFVATRALLPAAPVVVVRRSSFLWRARLAAAVAIVGGLSCLFLARGTSNGLDKTDLSALEADVDFALAIKTDGFGPSRESIDALYLDAHNVRDSFRQSDTITLDDGSL